IIPVYPQTAELTKIGLNSKGIRRLTSFIFEHLSDRWTDPLPEPERENLSLCPLGDAVRKLHYPETREEIEVGRRRMAFDELLLLQYLVYRNKGKKDATVKKHSYAAPGDKVSAFAEGLTFQLTQDQRQVASEIFTDLRKTRPMSRLLHGEVGSGKTVVAMLAAVYAAENNLQVAFMAPTEILVEQHFRNWQKPLARVGIQAALLTSSLRAAKRREVAERIAAGEVTVAFGTHALIYDYVSFQRLGLVIIDEQHRFGVEQRGRLYAKGEDPDLLVMTATPIPRTLALTLYGDLDISTIRTLPPGRQPVRTVWRTEDKAAKVYRYVHDEVKRGGQAYMIYPLIEKSDYLDLQNVEEAFDTLTRGVFHDLRVGLVHGRMKAKERDAVLTAFREGKVDILLSTTVIEVGIDNPNATLLVIQHAERFGLAQLHQLRGRVGRGEKPATVIALAYQPISEVARKRLEYFAAHRDGFEIAEADLELRGPGEMFGVRQSGAPELRLARLGKD
ncbi:MAG: ATP-dependent DNA helicase RecG, partial [Candidatus Zixiibacteriota bacterium]